MTVNEFMEWLATQDQGATVEVIEVLEGRGYEAYNPGVVYFDPDRHVEYIDLRGNPNAAGSTSRTLTLGEMQ
jgi:hypothetical protein